ncbi:uncharacterized protein JCM10292_003974 [Rhodotorula paludigena]|uniref:uncharacterized protein n=1 Tax=Rhodotorula paludigena TaxID=86838 RepID=UPI00317A6850
MLDRLPPELVAWIVECCGVGFDNEFSMRQSRIDLYNCCLVSRNLRIHAQPALWREVDVDELERSTSPADSPAFDELRRHTRVLWTRVFAPQTTSDLSAMYPNLDQNQVSLLLLREETEHLTEAVLRFQDFAGVPSSFRLVPLVRLVHLDLVITSAHTAALPVLARLTAETVPSLRTLVLGGHRIVQDTQVHPSLHAQLDLLQFSTGLSKRLYAASKTGWSAQVLVAVWQPRYEIEPFWALEADASPAIQHLRLHGSNSALMYYPERTLDALKGYDALETLYLPDHLSPQRLRGQVRQSADRLRDLLTARGVELRCVAPADFTGLNRDCWARARAKRREQAKE